MLLNEFLEATPEPASVLGGVAEHLDRDAIVAVAYSNMASLPSRILRRRWKSFFDHKVGYYSADNLEILMWRCGFRRVKPPASARPIRRRTSRHGSRHPRGSECAVEQRVRGPNVQLASGHEVIVFAADDAPPRADRLSIIVPVYNEARYVGEVLEALLDKELPIDREIVVVESNSSDGSARSCAVRRGPACG